MNPRSLSMAAMLIATLTQAAQTQTQTQAQHTHAQTPTTAPAPKEEPSTEAIASTLINDPSISVVELLRRDASRLLKTVTSPSVGQYLFSTNWAPVIDGTRVVYFNRATREAFSPDDFGNLSKERREGFEALTLDDKFYYNTKYGSPHAYTRPFDLLCKAANAEGKCFAPGQRLLDFGNGGVIHLRLLATMGLHTVGVDVDPLLRAFYREPTDQGTIPGGEEGVVGSLQLAWGSWPADEAVKQAVGGGFDFILSKNTLKKGYIHPEKPVDPRTQVQLGVSDEVFVGEVFKALKPGGFAMIYNICPAQSPEKYIPWADGKNPFPKAMWEKAGFTVLNFDTPDQEGVKAMARALGWDAGESPMDLEKDLFAWYTIAQRPAGEAAKEAAPSSTAQDAKPVAPASTK